MATSSARLRIHDLGRVEYGAALEIQERLVAAKLAGEADDHLLVLEHDNVYTLGRGADAGDLGAAPELLGVPVFRVGRGGGATFHGPGQLVAYPILALARHDRDVHRYVRSLEDVLIGTCARFGLTASVREGQPGVWVGSSKIASIGIGIRRWVTHHGIALNVATDLRFFEVITTCRMPDLRLTSLASELGCAPAMSEVRAVLVEQFRRVFAHRSARLGLPAAT